MQDIYIVTNLMESDLERIVRSKQRLTDQHFQYFLYQVTLPCLCPSLSSSLSASLGSLNLLTWPSLLCGRSSELLNTSTLPMSFTEISSHPIFSSMETVTLLSVTSVLPGPLSSMLLLPQLTHFSHGRGFDSENETMTEYVQTRWYRAPELLCDSPHYGRVRPSLPSSSFSLRSCW
jgi:hypothetical protein